MPSHSPASDPTTTSSRRDEQHVHSEPLPFGFGAAHGGRDVEAGRQPRSGNPEDADLQMPGARHGVGQPLRQRECRRSRCLRRRSARRWRPSATCTTQSAATTKKYLTVAFCDGVGLQAQQRIATRQEFLLRRCVVLRSEIPDHAADSGQQKDEADHAPHDGAAGWTIADERLHAASSACR